jgi:hypothetical protein
MWSSVRKSSGGREGTLPILVETRGRENLAGNFHLPSRFLSSFRLVGGKLPVNRRREIINEYRRKRQVIKVLNK